MNCSFAIVTEGIQQITRNIAVGKGRIQQISLVLGVSSSCLLVMVTSVQGRVLAVLFL
jgi:hypothetical protein